MALVNRVFFDTSVLLGGCIDFGPSSAAAQRLMDAAANAVIGNPCTAWHCCLEFYAVSTRLPPGYRLPPGMAHRMLKDILGFLDVEQLPGDERLAFLEEAVRERAAGGRVYDAHIAAIARLSGAGVVVTENGRHFTSLMKHGVRVLGARELAAELPVG